MTRVTLLRQPASVTRGDVVFFSDWRTATGTTDAAFTDGSKWGALDLVGDRSIWNARVGIDAATGLGFPAGMSNVFRFGVTGGTAGVLPVTGQWSAPTNPTDTLFWRFYFRSSLQEQTTGWRDGWHPMQNARFEHDLTFFKFSERDVSGQFRVRIEFEQSYSGGLGARAAGDDARNWITTARLDCDTVYRVECKFVKVTTNFYEFYPYIYTVAGVQVLGPGDWTNDYFKPDGGDRSFTGFFATATDPRLYLRDAQITHYSFGTNDASEPVPLAAYPTNNNRWYVGGFCVATDDFCGAYPISGVED